VRLRGWLRPAQPVCQGQAGLSTATMVQHHVFVPLVQSSPVLLGLCLLSSTKKIQVLYTSHRYAYPSSGSFFSLLAFHRAPGMRLQAMAAGELKAMDSSSPPTQYHTHAAASAMAAAASSYFAGPAIMSSQRAAAAPDNSAAASTPSPSKVRDPHPRDPSSHLPTPPNPNPFLVPIHSPATPASPDARPPPSATSPAPLPPQPRPSMLPAAGTPSSPSTASTPPT
jgi:hypothetical protein